MSFEATLENYLYAIDNVSGETAFILEEIGHIDSRVQGEWALPFRLASFGGQAQKSRLGARRKLGLWPKNRQPSHGKALKRHTKLTIAFYAVFCTLSCFPRLSIVAGTHPFWRSFPALSLAHGLVLSRMLPCQI